MNEFIFLLNKSTPIIISGAHSDISNYKIWTNHLVNSFQCFPTSFVLLFTNPAAPFSDLQFRNTGSTKVEKTRIKRSMVKRKIYEPSGVKSILEIVSEKSSCGIYVQPVGIFPIFLAILAAMTVWFYYLHSKTERKNTESILEIQWPAHD